MDDKKGWAARAIGWSAASAARPGEFIRACFAGGKMQSLSVPIVPSEATRGGGGTGLSSRRFISNYFQPREKTDGK